MTAITVRELTKRFGSQAPAVNGVDFAIEEGEFLVLVGPSGCGKTTLLRLLTGLEPVTTGEIRFRDRVVNDLRPKDRNVALVFQDYAIFPHLTVFENIAYGLRSRGAPRKQIGERVPAAARTFRIDHLLKRKPRQLSGGERQRVALSRAMVREADLYLYDEPLSNLDAQLRHQAREDILTLHQRQRKPSVYVTHDQSEAVSMGDRIAVMRAGRIEQLGTAADLYERPRNRFVAFFIGTPSINMFDVILQPEADRVVATGDGVALELPPELAAIGRRYAGEKVTMGIRPEDLHVPKTAPFEVTEENTLHGVVNAVEPGSTGSTVYLSALGTGVLDFVATLKVRMPASYLAKEVPLAVDMRRAHFFHPETEQSLRDEAGADAVS